MIKVISGFPGVGKSSMPSSIEVEGKQYKVVDLESTPYSWKVSGDGSKVRHPDFPFNYIDAIQEHVAQGHLVLVSSHAQIRQALMGERIPHMVVYPSLTLKREYMERYKNRGNDEAFLQLVSTNWYDWIEEIEEESEIEQDFEIHYAKMNSNIFLQDVLEMAL